MEGSKCGRARLYKGFGVARMPSILAENSAVASGCWGACYVSRQDCSIAGRPVPIWQPGNAEEAGRHGGEIEEQRAAGQSEGRTCIEGHATSRSGALTDHVVAIPLAHRRGRIGIVRRSGEGVVVGTSLRCRCCAGFAQHRLCESCVWGSANNTLLYTVVRYNGHQEKRQMQRCGMSGWGSRSRSVWMATRRTPCASTLKR